MRVWVKWLRHVVVGRNSSVESQPLSWIEPIFNLYNVQFLFSLFHFLYTLSLDPYITCNYHSFFLASISVTAGFAQRKEENARALHIHTYYTYEQSSSSGNNASPIAIFFCNISFSTTFFAAVYMYSCTHTNYIYIAKLKKGEKGVRQTE